MRTLSIVFGLALLATVPTRAQDWPQWRGPFFNGSTTAKDLPVHWSGTNNVTWVAPLPGRSSATPVIWGESVFVSSPDAAKNLLLLCLDRTSGQVRWRKIVAGGNRERGLNNMASPSPATDGQKVVCLFATGDLAAFDFAGQPLWKRSLAEEYGGFANMWIYGASPMLHTGRLYIQVLQRNPCPDDYTHARGDKAERESFLLCLDPQTGKTLWRNVRPTDAVYEAQEAYSTPVPNAANPGAEILVVGGNYVTAHSPDTGAELWRCGGLNDRQERFWRIVPSPVVADGLVIACGPKRDPVLAIKPGGKGLVTGTHIAWRFTEFPSDCVTPLCYQRKLFILDGDRQMMTCLEPQTGTKHWQGSLGVKETFRASPTGADGKVYCISEKGTVVVLDAGNEVKLLSTIRMGEGPVRSSIAAAYGALFIRTASNLYCIRGAAGAS